jgi:hypothetical protein
MYARQSKLVFRQRRRKLVIQHGARLVERRADYIVPATPIPRSLSKTCIIVRKGTGERNRALADLAIARRAVSFPGATTN